MEKESETKAGKRDHQMKYHEWVKSYCNENGLEANMEVCYSLTSFITYRIIDKLFLLPSIKTKQKDETKLAYKVYKESFEAKNAKAKT